MARIRSLKPSFFTDRRVTKLSFAGRLWFEGMWVFALCDAGHLDDDAYELRLKVFPADQVDEDALTDEVIGSGMVVRKELPDGRTYLQVVNLAVHSKSEKRWTPRCPYCAHESTPHLPPPPAAAANLPEPPARLVEPAETPATSAPEGFGLEGVTNLPAPAGADVLLLDVSRPDPGPPTERGPSVQAAFDAFWEAYPAKRDKPKARKAFERAIRRAPAAQIIAGARRYRDDPHRDPAKTKYPEGWLNGDRWNDADLPPLVAVNGPPQQRANGAPSARDLALNRHLYRGGQP